MWARGYSVRVICVVDSNWRRTPERTLWSGILTSRMQAETKQIWKFFCWGFVTTSKCLNMYVTDERWMAIAGVSGSLLQCQETRTYEIHFGFALFQHVIQVCAIRISQINLDCKINIWAAKRQYGLLWYFHCLIEV